MGIASQLDGHVSTPRDFTKRGLREWWFNLIRRYDKFPTYSIFMVLPMDTAVLDFLAASNTELDLISGRNCLVLALADEMIGLYGDTTAFFEELTEEKKEEYKAFIWKSSIREQASKGISLEIAKLFGIKLKELPCMVLFKDIRVSEYVLISLKGLSVEEITQRMRTIFSLLEEAIIHNEDPLEMLVKYQKNEALKKAGTSFISGIKKISAATLEVAFKAFLETTITP